MKYTFGACFYPEEEGGFTVVIPDLPGAVTYGDTLEEAFEMAVDCASGWLVDENEIPEPTPLDVIQLDQEMLPGFKSYIFVDLIDYKKKHLSKSVKKTLTIPQWLNDMAEKEHINFSGVLQEALKEKLDVQDRA